MHTANNTRIRILALVGSTQPPPSLCASYDRYLSNDLPVGQANVIATFPVDLLLPIML